MTHLDALIQESARSEYRESYEALQQIMRGAELNPDVDGSHLVDRNDILRTYRIRLDRHREGRSHFERAEEFLAHLENARNAQIRVISFDFGPRFYVVAVDEQWRYIAHLWKSDVATPTGS